MSKDWAKISICVFLDISISVWSGLAWKKISSWVPNNILICYSCRYNPAADQSLGGTTMATPPERYKTTKSTFFLTCSLNNRGCNFGTFLNAEISKKTKLKPKQGSKRYQHFRKFIERRREKKLEKRHTLDLTARVILMMMMRMVMMMMWW